MAYGKRKSTRKASSSARGTSRFSRNRSSSTARRKSGGTAARRSVRPQTIRIEVVQRAEPLGANPALPVAPSVTAPATRKARL